MLVVSHVIVYLRLLTYDICPSAAAISVSPPLDVPLVAIPPVWVAVTCQGIRVGDVGLLWMHLVC